MGRVRVKTLLILLSITAVIATAITKTNFAEQPTTRETVTEAGTDFHSVVNSRGSERVAGETPSNMRVVLVALGPEGFEPAEMLLSSGEYLFVVKNRTGLDEVNLRLVNQNDQQVLAARVGFRRQDLKRRLQLAPGTYRLTIMDHPDWSATLIVNQ